MELLGDLVAPERRSSALAYELAGDRTRSYSYDAFCTNAWKAGNLMRHYGVRPGSTVGVVDGPKDPDDPSPTPVPETLLGLLGASLLGAAVRFDPPPDAEVRAVVGPASRYERFDLPPGSTYLAYGGPPGDPAVAHFERELWSENPIPMPAEFGPETAALRAGEESYDHAGLLSAAESVVTGRGLTENDVVRVDAPLSDPGTVVAGVFAPLLAGGTITADGPADLTVGDAPDALAPATARPG